jgi:hypothetical protein
LAFLPPGGGHGARELAPLRAAALEALTAGQAGGSGGPAWARRMRRLLLLEEGQAERDVLAFDTFNTPALTVRHSNMTAYARACRSVTLGAQAGRHWSGRPA